uniref:Uncharacterized protein n=1 Tax=Populus trichocarpa TaxID=3694 RepID=B9HYY3_POPTR
MVGGVETKVLFHAMAYLVCGLPAANWLWYRPLCQALMTENASMLLSPPVIAISGRSLKGILSALDISGGDYAEIGWVYFHRFWWVQS